MTGHTFTVAVQARGPRAGDWFDVDDVTLTVGLLPNPVVPPTLIGGAHGRTHPDRRYRHLAERSADVYLRVAGLPHRVQSA